MFGFFCDFVFVREYMRRPPYSYGRGEKTVHVVSHYRRYPRW